MQISHLAFRRFSIVKFLMAQSNVYNGTKAFSSKTFENAIETLNSLQTNSSSLNISIKMKQQQLHNVANLNLRETEKFLERIDGFDLNTLDKLSVIHVSGSKGKGSVCTFTEAILREYNIKTGLFTSPHLESCRERIKLLGQPINKSKFNSYFWKVYDALESKKDHENDLPSYFKFLQIMAFYIFIQEKVDVAIVEVGIGGQYDSTNIIRNTELVGITSLQLEHTQLLGDSIEEIAWQKAGIIKKDSYVYYIHHSQDSVNQVIQDRFKELYGKRLSTVPHFDEYIWSNNLVPDFTQSSEINKINFSMAAQMSAKWLRNRNILSDKLFKNDLLIKVEDNFVRAIQKCKFEGRFQEIKSGNLTFFLDGAHTKDSMNITSKWFSSRTSCNMKYDQINILIFNVTGERDAKQMLEPLLRNSFDIICFTTNLESSFTNKQNENFYGIYQEIQYERCIRHKEIWMNICDEKNFKHGVVECFRTIQQAIDYVYNAKDNNSNTINVLVTGSLHLIGGVLKTVKFIEYGEQNKIKNQCLQYNSMQLKP